ncbi:MAG: CBS domain-containing protein [Candidatus Micrarchaeota archaeon]
MNVRDIMHSVTIVDATSSVYEVSKLMSKKNIGSVLISFGDEVKGIFTERDLLNKVVVQGLNAYLTPVEKVMSYPVVSIDADATVLDASMMLNKHGRIRRLVVTEAGKIVGITTARKIAKNLPYHNLETIRHKRDYGRISYYEERK